MKVLFRDLDLYKVIILACLVLLPVAGFFAWSLRKQIEEGERSVASAIEQGGTLERIGVLQKQVENLVNSQKRTGQVQDHGVYFENQLFRTKGSPLSQDDFTINPVQPKPGRRGKQSYIDYEVGIVFDRKGAGRNASRISLQRDFVYAMLFNCESQSAVPGVWKLKNFSMTNSEAQDYLKSYKTPPPELKDEWVISKLSFVRRGPAATGR